ncbi:MAG: pantetheine-phosphate adenylyltransferase [Erysipelotrichaceae bacterium]
MNKIRKAIYPGTFDPITRGHLDIIERSSKLFDEVIVVIMDNPDKICLFSEEERLDMIKDACKNIENVRCCIGSGLSVDFATKCEAQVLIRGIRAVQDYEYELQTATANMWLNDQIETLFLLSKPNYSFLSSSSVKVIAQHNADVTKFVSDYVKDKLIKKYNKE